MIANTNPAVNVNDLMAKVNERINGSAAAAYLNAEGLRVLPGDTVTAVAKMEALIQIAESSSQIRTSWGTALRRFPFNAAPLRGFFLKVLAFIFRDQRQVNAALVDSLRASLQLNIRLCEQIDSLRARLDEIDRKTSV